MPIKKKTTKKKVKKRNPKWDSWKFAEFEPYEPLTEEELTILKKISEIDNFHTFLDSYYPFINAVMERRGGRKFLSKHDDRIFMRYLSDKIKRCLQKD